jgi:hypothetical protein
MRSHAKETVGRIDLSPSLSKRFDDGPMFLGIEF